MEGGTAMKHITMYIPRQTEALKAAREHLEQAGVVFAEAAQEAEYLLCPAPTAPEVLDEYTPDHTVIGGNLDFLSDNVARLDLLKDPYYLAANAAITAEAAVGLVLQTMKRSAAGAKMLILGWGRIGKCLTHQLTALGADLTVYARKDADRAMLRALGYRYTELREDLTCFDCILNTIPARVLTEPLPGLLVELASGVWLPGENVLVAHGLPGKCKPAASGELIAKTILYHLGGMKA